MTTKRVWVNNHKPAEKVKIKPPSKKATLNKITFEIHVQIHKLCTQLPQVPFFLVGTDGKAKLQQTTKVEFKGQSGAANGKRVNNLMKGKLTRHMNHKVTLNQQYQLLGQSGIDSYVDYVISLARDLQALSDAAAKSALTAELKAE